MKSLKYSDGQPVRIGDKFTAPRWGTCTVKRFDRLNGCAVAVNTQTGEEFDNLGRDTFGESDLWERKARAPRFTVTAEIWHGTYRATFHGTGPSIAAALTAITSPYVAKVDETLMTAKVVRELETTGKSALGWVDYTATTNAPVTP